MKKMMNKDDIGLQLYKMRQRKMMTLQQVSDECGVSISCLSEYENGNKMPRLDTIEKILSVYGGRILILDF